MLDKAKKMFNKWLDWAKDDSKPVDLKQAKVGPVAKGINVSGVSSGTEALASYLNLKGADLYDLVSANAQDSSIGTSKDLYSI